MPLKQKKPNQIGIEASQKQTVSEPHQEGDSIHGVAEITHIYIDWFLGFECYHQLSLRFCSFYPSPFLCFMLKADDFPSLINCGKFYLQLSIVGRFGSQECHDTELQVGNVYAFDF